MAGTATAAEPARQATGAGVSTGGTDSPRLSRTESAMVGLDYEADPEPGNGSAPEPPAGNEAGGVPPEDPAAAGQSAGENSKPQPGAVEGKPQDGKSGKPEGETKPEAKPGDEDIAVFDALTPKADDGKQRGDEETQAALTPENIEKAINPDGTATPEVQLTNARKLIVDSQSMVGRQAKEIGDLRQERNTLREGVEEITNSGIFNFDESGRATVNFAKAASTLTADEAREQLAGPEVGKLLEGIGLRLVPLHGADGGSNADGSLQAEVLNELIPDKDIPLEEKRRRLAQNPDLQITYLEKLQDRKVKAQAAEARKDIASRQQEQAQRNEELRALESLKATVPHFEELRPAMARWNKVVPGEVRGALRMNLLRRLAELDRVPAILRRVQAAALKKGRELGLSESGLLTPDGGGGGAAAKIGGGGQKAALSGSELDRVGLG